MTRAAALLLLFLLPLSASAGTLDKGRYSFGLSGGAGKRFASVGFSFGYLVVDGLQPSIALGYAWQGYDRADAHRLETTLELRYYVYRHAVVAPYVFVDGSHVYLAYRGAPDEDHNFFRAGGGLGALFLVAPTVGFSVSFRVGSWLGADDALYDRGVLEEAPLLDFGFGFGVFL